MACGVATQMAANDEAQQLLSVRASVKLPGDKCDEPLSVTAKCASDTSIFNVDVVFDCKTVETVFQGSLIVLFDKCAIGEPLELTLQSGTPT